MVVTKDYQSVPVPEDTVETICKSDQFKTKSQLVDVNTILLRVHDDQSNNYDNNNHTPFSNKNQYLQETNTFLRSSLLLSLRYIFL